MWWPASGIQFKLIPSLERSRLLWWIWWCVQADPLIGWNIVFIHKTFLWKKVKLLYICCESKGGIMFLWNEILRKEKRAQKRRHYFLSWQGCWCLFLLNLVKPGTFCCKLWMLAHCYPRPVAKKHRPVVCKFVFCLFCKMFMLILQIVLMFWCWSFLKCI